MDQSCLQDSVFCFIADLLYIYPLLFNELCTVDNYVILMVSNVGVNAASGGGISNGQGVGGTPSLLDEFEENGEYHMSFFCYISSEYSIFLCQ